MEVSCDLHRLKDKIGACTLADFFNDQMLVAWLGETCTVKEHPDASVFKAVVEWQVSGSEVHELQFDSMLHRLCDMVHMFHESDAGPNRRVDTAFGTLHHKTTVRPASVQGKSTEECDNSLIVLTVNVTRTDESTLPLLFTNVAGKKCIAFHMNVNDTFGYLKDKLSRSLPRHMNGRVKLVLPNGVDLSQLKLLYNVRDLCDLSESTIGLHE